MNCLVLLGMGENPQFSPRIWQITTKESAHKRLMKDTTCLMEENAFSYFRISVHYRKLFDGIILANRAENIPVC